MSDPAYSMIKLFLACMQRQVYFLVINVGRLNRNRRALCNAEILANEFCMFVIEFVCFFFACCGYINAIAEGFGVARRYF